MNKLQNAVEGNIIGVISDTHNLLRPEAIQILKGSDLIIHAGDIGSLHILEHLREIAPIIVVRGNNDKAPWAEEIPIFKKVDVGAVSIYIIHDIKEMDIDPVAAGFKVVISGHSHKPSVKELEGVLYLNPGSAGPRRFSLPVSVARLKVKGKIVNAEIIELSV